MNGNKKDVNLCAEAPVVDECDSVEGLSPKANN